MIGRAGRWIAGGLASAAVLVAGDVTWLSLATPRFYRPVLGPLLAARPDAGAAAAFYGLYLVGVMAFGVAPGVKARAWTRSLVSGALLGLVAYGTYDLTNQATLRIWSVNISLMDMGWGALLTGLASAAGCAVALSAARRRHSASEG